VSLSAIQIFDKDVVISEGVPVPACKLHNAVSVVLANVVTGIFVEEGLRQLVATVGTGGGEQGSTQASSTSSLAS
jgi:hypothetical protein